MKKGILPLALGILLFLSSLVAPIPLFLSIFSEDTQETVFKIPGEQIVVVDEPGRYYLWHHHHALFEGEVFAGSEDLPNGLTISISNPELAKLKFVADSSMSSSSGSSSKNSIGYVVVTQPQQLHIQVSNSPEPAVFSFSQSNFKETFTKIIAFFTISFFGILGGIVLIVVGIIKLCHASQTPPPLPTQRA